MQTNKGFTLIELLIVIAIIGLLAVLTLASLTPARLKSRDARRKEDINAVAKAIELYYSDFEHYPDSDSGHNCSAAATLCTEVGYDALASPLTTGPGQYIIAMPVDSSNSGNLVYRAGNNGTDQGFAVEADLEYVLDPQGIEIVGRRVFRLCGGTFHTNCSQ